MKVQVVNMYPDQAIASVLEQYDIEPSRHDIHKLLSNKAIQLLPVGGDPLPKGYSPDKLVDLTQGELLSLGVLGAAYQRAYNKGFHVSVGVADTYKSQVENSLSDGAIAPFGSKDSMAVQQVQAQAYHLPKGKTIEDEIVEKIQDKESIRSNYPKKCALLISVYAKEGGFYVARLMSECSLAEFNEYFCVVYHQMPEMKTCTVLHLDKRLSPQLAADQGVKFSLAREDFGLKSQ